MLQIFLGPDFCPLSLRRLIGKVSLGPAPSHVLLSTLRGEFLTSRCSKFTDTKSLSLACPPPPYWHPSCEAKGRVRIPLGPK